MILLYQQMKEIVSIKTMDLAWELLTVGDEGVGDTRGSWCAGNSL